MGFENLDQGGEKSIEDEIKRIGADLRSMTRFIGRHEDSDKIFKDILKWAAGSDFDNPDRKEHYPNWTPEDFQKLIIAAGLTVEGLRSRLGDEEDEE